MTTVVLSPAWKDEGWFSMPRAIARDGNLSWKAKGLVAFLASHTESYEFSSEGLGQRASDGRLSTQTGLRELESAGYLRRLRQPSGRMVYELSPVPIKPEVENRPEAVPIKPEVENRSDRKPIGPKTDRSSTEEQLKAVRAVEVQVEQGAKTPARRATPVPDAFVLTPGERDAARSKLPRGTDIDAEVEHFLDHHRARGNTMKDWRAAWRTWVLLAAKYSATRSGKVTRPYQPDIPECWQ